MKEELWCEHNRNITGVYNKCEACILSPQPEEKLSLPVIEGAKPREPGEVDKIMQPLKNLMEIMQDSEPEEWGGVDDIFSNARASSLNYDEALMKEIKLYVSDEIRKAEERKVDEILKALLKKARETDYADRTEYDVAYDFIKNLEALKK
jgi:hypothetical protein